MKRTLILLFFLAAGTTFGQVNSINLEDCYRLARENYPRLPDAVRQQQISELKQKNIGTAWNPQLNLNGQATYQSEVTRVNISIPGVTIAQPPNDQFKLYLDARQTIYDGGAVRANRSVEEANLAAEQQNLEVELYTLHERINQLYFTVLLLKENEAVLKSKKTILDERIKMMESMFRNGVITSRDLDLLKAERLLTDQQLGELRAERLSATGMLGILTNQVLDDGTVLAEPAVSPKNEAIIRPELRYFELLGNKLDQNSQLLQRSRNPKVFGFGQAGYGRPGLNMLKNTVEPYYLVGLGVSWNITDWKQTGRSREILEVQKQMVGSQRAVFDQNLSIAMFKAEETIKKAEELLKIDEELVLLRGNIARQSASQLENGTITSADYIVDLNAVTQANINKRNHKVQLYYAVINYNTLAGKP